MLEMPRSIWELTVTALLQLFFDVFESISIAETLVASFNTFLSIILPPLKSTLFPYTTLFRSLQVTVPADCEQLPLPAGAVAETNVELTGIVLVSTAFVEIGRAQVWT